MSIRRMASVALSSFVIVGSVEAQPVISLVPVRINPHCVGGSNDGELCLSNEDCNSLVCGGAIAPSDPIEVAPGDLIVVEVLAAEWSPNGERLRAFLTAMDVASYRSGRRGIVAPVLTDEPCDQACEGCGSCGQNRFCFAGCCRTESAFGFGILPPSNSVSPYWWRTDYVFAAPFEPKPADICDGDFCTQRASCILRDADDARLYRGVPPYLYFILLQVSADALGTFMITMQPPPETALLDENVEPIVPLTPQSLSVDVVCDATPVVQPKETCAVDPRQPSQPDGSDPEGLDHVSFT